MGKVLTLTEFHLRSIKNWRQYHYGRLVEPLFYYALLVRGVAGVARPVPFGAESVAYSVFAFPGILGLIALRAGTSAVLDSSHDRKWGVYALARVSRVSTGSYVASLLLAEAAVVAVQFIMVAGLAWRLGDIKGLDLFVGMVAFLMVCAFWALAGIAVGLFVGSLERRDLLLSLTLLPVAFAAPLFFPLDNAPAYIRELAALNPLSYQVTAIRDLLSGGSAPPALIELGASVVVALVAALWIGSRTEWLTTEQG